MGRFDSLKNTWDTPPPAPDATPDNAKTFTLLPDGIYVCEVFNIEEKQPAKGGEAFSVTLLVVAGEHSRRRVWDWINFNLPHSAKATEIGQRSFRDLCQAAGFVDTPPSELGDLIGQELDVQIGTRAASGGYPAKNCVRRYLAQKATTATTDDTAGLF